ILARTLSIPILPITFLTSSLGFEAYSHTSLTLLNAAFPADLIPLAIFPNVPFAYAGRFLVSLALNTCVPFGRFGYIVVVGADTICFPFGNETSSLPLLEPFPSPSMAGPVFGCPPVPFAYCG